MRNDPELVACVAESGVPWQVTVVRSRPDLRNNVSSIRNEAEIIDAHAKVIGKRYTGRVAGKGSDLNKRLRVECLEESGTKGDKCARLAAYTAMLKNKIPLDQA